MLFWTRALLCVGTLTVLAIRHEPQAMLPSGPAVGLRASGELVGAMCKAHMDACLGAVAGEWSTLAPAAVPSLPRAVKPAVHPGAPRVPVAIAVRSLT